MLDYARVQPAVRWLATRCDASLVQFAQLPGGSLNLGEDDAWTKTGIGARYRLLRARGKFAGAASHEAAKIMRDDMLGRKVTLGSVNADNRGGCRGHGRQGVPRRYLRQPGGLGACDRGAPAYVFRKACSGRMSAPPRRAKHAQEFHETSLDHRLPNRAACSSRL